MTNDQINQKIARAQQSFGAGMQFLQDINRQFELATNDLFEQYIQQIRIWIDEYVSKYRPNPEVLKYLERYLIHDRISISLAEYMEKQELRHKRSIILYQEEGTWKIKTALDFYFSQGSNRSLRIELMRNPFESTNRSNRNFALECINENDLCIMALCIKTLIQRMEFLEWTRLQIIPCRRV